MIIMLTAIMIVTTTIIVGVLNLRTIYPVVFSYSNNTIMVGGFDIKT